MSSDLTAPNLQHIYSKPRIATESLNGKESHHKNMKEEKDCLEKEEDGQSN